MAKGKKRRCAGVCLFRAKPFLRRPPEVRVSPLPAPSTTSSALSPAAAFHACREVKCAHLCLRGSVILVTLADAMPGSVARWVLGFALGLGCFATFL